MARTMRTMTVGILVILLFGACQKRPAPKSGAPVLARVGDAVITTQDMENRLSSFSRSRYFMDANTNPEKKKELLKTMVDTELLYQEARRKGYDQDPAVKREAVSRMLQNEVDAQTKPEAVSDAEVEKYYKEHASQFSRLDQVRVTQIVVKDQKKAAKVVSEAKALSKGNLEALRALVTKYSEDEASKAKGGDIGLVDSNTSSIPKPILDAALGVKEAFDIPEPIKTDAGYTIVIVTQKVPGFTRSVQEAKPSIQSTLLFELRKQKRDSLTAELRQKTQVQIDEAQLANVKLNPPAGGPGMDHPGPGGPGMMPRMPPHGMPGMDHPVPGGPAKALPPGHP
jgi:peptidyl-prolyl cis-trans isomerase C